MDTDDILVHDLHQVLLKDRQNVDALQLLAQIHSRQGRAIEAAQTVKNLLKVNHYRMDDETLNTLSPAVLKVLKTDEKQTFPLTPPQSPTEKEEKHTASNHRSPSPPQTHPTTRHSWGSSVKRFSGFHRLKSLSFLSKHSQSKELVESNDSANSQDTSRGSQSQDSASNGNGTKFNRPPPVKEVVNRMASDPSNSLTIAIDDLSSLLSFSRAQSPPPNADSLRSACVSRAKALASALHPKYAYLASQALMHLTHEQPCLEHTYTNTETMITGDPLSTITRSNFFASEDNYAWDMEELVAALKANPATSFRNPLSRAPFTTADVAAIIHHPLGKDLAAVQVQQREMSKGVRKETVERLAKVSKVMLEDEDSMEKSREAMDEFAGYTASLPGPEKEALSRLRVPAKDSHTGLGYDATVGEMLADAKSNKVCGHKAGDFLAQAVEYLKKPRRF